MLGKTRIAFFFPFLLVAPSLLNGCTGQSLMASGVLSEVQARRSLRVELGPELVLLDKPAVLSTCLITHDGRVHIFVTDTKKQLHHFEIADDKIVANEVFGLVDVDENSAMDAVEQPKGKLRLLVGEKQYIRSAPDGPWREIAGNKCARFISVGNSLFCAFVATGKEIGAPQRTDYTVGWFILAPVVLWSNTQAAKLVVAQESNDVWTIRGVIDPETERDADRDFMAGSDGHGTLHFLYSTSRGGGFAFVVVPGADGGFLGFRPELHYASVTLDQILSNSTESPERSSSPVVKTTPPRWVTIPAATLPDMPSVFLPRRSPRWGTVLRPFNRRFTVNELSGEVDGLVILPPYSVLVDGTRKVSLGHFEHLAVELKWRGGQWAPSFDIVAAKNVPDSTYHEFWMPVINSGPNGDIHALLEHCEYDEWKFNPLGACYIDYIVKDGPNWSAPVTLGNRDITLSHYDGSLSELSVTDSRNAFAAWVNAENKFVGRWIRPRDEP